MPLTTKEFDEEISRTAVLMFCKRYDMRPAPSQNLLAIVRALLAADRNRTGSVKASEDPRELEDFVREVFDHASARVFP